VLGFFFVHTLFVNSLNLECTTKAFPENTASHGIQFATYRGAFLDLIFAQVGTAARSLEIWLTRNCSQNSATKLQTTHWL
jgi:hypothetical protein